MADVVVVVVDDVALVCDARTDLAPDIFGASNEKLV